MRYRITRTASLAALLLGAAFPGATYGVETGSLVISAPANAVVCNSFLGFGVEWDTERHTERGITDADIALMKRRIEWMRPPLVRMMMSGSWAKLLGKTAELQRSQFQDACRVLDVLQSLGTTVMLTDWNIEAVWWEPWRKEAGVADMADPAYARVIGDYLELLVKNKGYTCIRYFALQNEPNLVLYNKLQRKKAADAGKALYFVRAEFDRWATGLRNVAAELKRRGLDRQITLAGPDETLLGFQPGQWLRLAADELGDMIGIWDVHYYRSAAFACAGASETEMRTLCGSALLAGSPHSDKPFLLGELGVLDETIAVDSFQYGLCQVDHALQAARAGVSGMSFWALDSNAYNVTAPDNPWGLWSPKAAGMKLRPVFYSWSLLSHCFPRGAVIHAPYVGKHPGLRTLAARIPARETGKPDDWSFCLINRGGTAIKAMLKAPSAAGSLEMKEYRYTKESVPKSDDVLVLPAKPRTAVSLGKGHAVECPANSVLVVTSLP